MRETSHPTHINMEQSLDYMSRIKAKQSYMIHMTHDLEYATLSNKLVKNSQASVFVGFDGLKLNFSWYAPIGNVNKMA